VTAGGEDDSVRVDNVPGAVVQVEAVRAEGNVVADEEFCDVDRIEDRNLQLHGAVNQGSLDLEARVVTGERGPAEGVRTEESLRDASVFLSSEGHAVALEVLDATSRTLGHDLHRDGVGEKVALLEGVSCMLLPGVLGIDSRERSIDAARGEGRVGVRFRALAHGNHVHPPLSEFNRGA